MTVDEMLQRITSREISEWKIVYQLRRNENEKARKQQS